MREEYCDVVIVGAGPAGLAAASAAKVEGAEKVIVVERDVHAGGILQQCIHAGFGLKYFGEELTGPEYAERFETFVKESDVKLMLNTTALEVRENVLVCDSSEGIIHIHYGAMVLAMGCRERTRANLVIPGSRPAGIYTAGTAQRLINIYGHHVGKEIVILGSGDIGMIMARRMSIEGAHVKAVVEIMPFLAGLIRNKVQCLDDFGIPLMLSHTVVDITGVDRVESVTIAPVDKNKKPIMEKAEVIPCDTLLLSVGLIPENELSKTAGVSLSQITKGREISVVPGDGVRYVCPQKIITGGDEDVTLYFRTVIPGRNSVMEAEAEGQVLAKRKAICTSPGTMEQLTLTAEQIKDLTGNVTVKASHEEELS